MFIFVFILLFMSLIFKFSSAKSVLDCRTVWKTFVDSMETIPLSKITTSILIFPSFHLLPNLVSNPQAKLILFPLVSEMFLFRAVIRVNSFILLVSCAWPIEHF